MNVVQRAFQDGRPSVGLWTVGPSALSAEVLGRTDLDWALLDMQHGAIDSANLLPTLQALELGGTSALVRVADNRPDLIMRALDLGAIGVVVPMVSTPEEAASAAQACLYPPAGYRSFGPVRRFYDPQVASAYTTCLVMIETAQGLLNVDAIAATPGVDGLFVGPVDLGLALGAGLTMKTDTGVVADGIKRVVRAAHEHGVIAGVAGFSPEHAEQLLDIGADLVTIGSDTGLLSAGVSSGVTRVREHANHPA